MAEPKHAFSTKAVLTVDIVDFSKRDGDAQVAAIKALIELLHQAIPEEHNHPGARTWSPAGDGGAITFEALGPALTTAVSLAKLVEQYNKGLFVDRNGKKIPKPAQPLELRTGLHAGPVSKEVDFDERENVWGAGLNMSARVAGLAHPGQILASEAFYQQAELKKYRKTGEVTSIGEWWAKHNRPVVLYNIAIGGVGIPCSEVEEWYGPFHYPLETAIRTYEAMAEKQAAVGPAFRAAVLAKRLIDLNPQHKQAKRIIESISQRRFRRTPGATHLYDVFFSHLSPGALLYFFQNARFENFESSEVEAVICEEGDKADSMMMVVSGQVIPFIGEKRIKVPASDLPEGEKVLVLTEGDIIGEMGLFNPGEKRTATLKVPKRRRAITLTLNYRFLKEARDSTDRERKFATEIRNRTWEYYCERTIQNLLSTHPLMQNLTGQERNSLFDVGEFLPSHFEEPIQLEVNDVWNAWIMVVAGSVILYDKDNRPVEFKQEDCLGAVRLVVGDSPPYTKVEVASHSHLVCFPWAIIEEIVHANESFDYAAASVGRKIRKRLKI